MQFFDGAIIVVFAGFIWFGFWRGLIQTFGSIVGIFLGVILASRWYEGASAILGETYRDHAIVNIVAFIVLFLLISKLTGVLFQFVHKAFHILAVLPGLKLINRLGGAILGAVEGALFLGVVLNFIKTIAETTIFADSFANSGLTSTFIGFASWLVPLFPEAIREIEAMI